MNHASTSSTPSSRPKVLLIGSGIAGLAATLHFSEFADVILLAKSSLDEGNTRYAQGGISAVWSKNDSFEEHIKDTLVAGAGLCRESSVNACVREAPHVIESLIRWGVEFTKTEPGADETGFFGYDLHQEGGHHKRRILHMHDSTGLAIEEALVQQVRKLKNVTLLENHMAIDLIMDGKLEHKNRSRGMDLGKCIGAFVLDCKSGNIFPLSANLTVIASGGAGKAYLYTTNPDVATGDGVAMAYRAGARIANMEFMQFHPTCLFHPNAKNFLITEAIRGEGAVLRNFKGEDFMKAHHPMGSLAPRDIVARAIDLEMKRTGEPHVWLDASKITHFKEHFPQIYDFCHNLGIHPPQDFIPVVPAAHYLCGGIWVDDVGNTTVEGLAAIGEASCTGLHGANRLASNSLLEGAVFAKRIAEWAKKSLLQRQNQQSQENQREARPLPIWDFGRAVDIEEQIDIAGTWREIRTLMWNYVGIVRSDRRLKRARERLALIRHEVNEDYWKFKVNRDLIELRNLLTVSELIVECALRRKESRGLHYNVDYPHPLELELKDTLV